MRKKTGSKAKSAAASYRSISASTTKPADWRADALARMRKLIKEADPHAVEEIKWRKPSNPAGVPVWSHDGLVCTGETYKAAVKLTFARGAALKDPARLFNASLEGNARRAIDIHEGETVDAAAFRALFRAAVALNTAHAAARKGHVRKGGARKSPAQKGGARKGNVRKSGARKKG